MRERVECVLPWSQVANKPPPHSHTHTYKHPHAGCSSVAATTATAYAAVLTMTTNLTKWVSVCQNYHNIIIRTISMADAYMNIYVIIWCILESTEMIYSISVFQYEELLQKPCVIFS